VTIVVPISLPVTGSTIIAGTPNMNVVNSPTVNVGNPASSPVPIADVNHAMQPVQATVSVNIQDSQTAGQGTLYTVGASKRLVIEYVSMFCPGFVGVGFTGIIGTVVGGVSVGHLVTQIPATTVPQSFPQAEAGGPVRLYADPGTSVTLQVSRTDNRVNIGCLFSFSGHLVNV
jgi:hypothetical protein